MQSNQSHCWVPREDNPAMIKRLCNILLLIILMISVKFNENLTKTVQVVCAAKLGGITDWSTGQQTHPWQVFLLEKKVAKKFMLNW